jgi:hypothetical protein
MYEQRVKQDVLGLHEYAHHREDWVHPLKEVLESIPAAEAAKPGVPELRSIWQIVNHMTVWSGHVERWYPGCHHDLPEGSTPPLPAIRDEAAWDSARERLLRAVEGLRMQIVATPPSELFEPAPDGTTLLEEFLGRMIHNAYHIGQLTVLRELALNPK